MIEGPSSTLGRESKGEPACQLCICNSACIIHNVTEAWGRGGKNRKNRDSRYSVAGAGDGKWPGPLRPPWRSHTAHLCIGGEKNSFI